MARSMFSNQEIQSTPCSEHFWKLGCGKMAGHCGAKHIFKTRNTKHTMLGALLEVRVWKNGRSLWREAYFQIKRYKAHHARSTFGSWGVEKMGGHCGAKHVFKSRNTKHTMIGALLEVGAWKKGRSLWREACFQIKKYKTHHVRSTLALLEVAVWKNGRSLWCETYFQNKKYKAHHARSTFGSWGVEKWQVTVVRSVFSNKEIQNTPCSEHFWKLGCEKMAGHCGAKHIFKSRNQNTPCSEHFSTLGSWGVEKW